MAIYRQRVRDCNGGMALALGIVVSLTRAWSCCCYQCGNKIGRGMQDITQDDGDDANM